MSDIVDLPLPLQLKHWARTRPQAVALRQKEYGIWRPVTWAEYDEQARSFGLGLRALGVERGQSVAILSENRVEWVFSQLGASFIGAIPAGIYPTSPAHEVEYLLTLAESPVVVLEDQEQLDKVLEVAPRLPLLRAIVVLDNRGLRNYQVDRLHSFTEVQNLGRQYSKESPNAALAALRDPQPDDLALIIFTSGSTGRPKASLSSWRGLSAANKGLNSVLKVKDADSVVSYLPLCHMAEQMFSVQIPMATGASVNFSESLRTVQDDLREIAPTIFFGVPRIWEKFHSSITSKLREAGGIRYWLYDRARVSLGRFVQLPRDQWSWSNRMTWAIWYVVILRALLNFIGLRESKFAISAGAPISPEILSFFRMLGVPIREAYGMTESCGAVAVQQDERSIVGTVGAPYPGVEVKLAEDGEILIRGEMVFRGYFRNPEATREALDDEGWLHSGDVARWEDGPAGRELRIVDRKKDIMITAGGKNITPSEIENALKFSPYIKEAIVIADRRRFVSALIQVDFENASKWVEDQGLTYTNFRSLVELPSVASLIQAEVDAVNLKMPQVQHVRKFHLLTKELDQDDGEVTATMKVKRKSISEKYADAIEALYA